MARSMWAGSISFGLVNIPVKVFTAVHQKEIHFHQLHREDGGRIRLKRVCSKDGEEVPYQEIDKGYELSKGHYVRLTRQELEAVAPESSRAINLEDFVELGQIDPVFYEHTYYLVPDKGAERPYALLLEAMRQTQRVGIARMVMRTKEYLCAIRPLEDALAMSTMQFADEIVPVSELDDLPKKSARPKERELKMAQQLVESLSSDWKPEKYKDDHRERVEALIEKKAAGEDILAEVEAPHRPEKVVSLMDALQRSLAAGREPSRPPRKAASSGKKSRPSAAAARTVRRRAPARGGKKAPAAKAKATKKK